MLPLFKPGMAAATSSTPYKGEMSRGNNNATTDLIGSLFTKSQFEKT